MSSLCEWGQRDAEYDNDNSIDLPANMNTATRSRSSDSSMLPMIIPDDAEKEPRQEPLLCGWNHPKQENQKLERSARSKSEGQLLCGWSQSTNNNNSYNSSDDEGGGGGKSILYARKGVRSMRSLHQKKASTKQALQRNERWSARRTVSREPVFAGSPSPKAQQEDDGVVTYLGKEYSARDIFQRCQDRENSTRSLRSKSCTPCSRHSSNEAMGDDQSNTNEAEVSPNLKKPGFMQRSFSSLARFGDSKNDIMSWSFEDSQPPQQTPSSPRRPQLSKSEEYRSLKLEKSQSCRHLSVEELDDQVDGLQVQDRDVQMLIDNPIDFAALKQTLKSNGAITNGLLQQGLHVFVHQHREKKLREQQMLEKKKKRRSPRTGVYSKPRRQQSMPSSA